MRIDHPQHSERISRLLQDMLRATLPEHNMQRGEEWDRLQDERLEEILQSNLSYSEATLQASVELFMVVISFAGLIQEANSDSVAISPFEGSSFIGSMLWDMLANINQVLLNETDEIMEIAARNPALVHAILHTRDQMTELLLGPLQA